MRNGHGVEIRSSDFEEGYRRSTRSINLASDVGWNTAAWDVIREQPNADELIMAITERWYARWIDPARLTAEDGTKKPR